MVFNGSVSSSSLITLAVAGSSGATIGTTATLAAYKGTTPLYVSIIWYNQSGNGRNAILATAANQPELLIASQNNQAVLVFEGTKNIPVTATAQQLLGTTVGGVTGVVGTLLFTSKITASGNTPESFGFKSTT